MNQRDLGKEKENMAQAFLQERGVCITGRNFRCRQGEIDLIGYDEGYLVFFEVKFRAGKGAGHPAEAVNYYKQNTICRVSDYYRYVHGCPDCQPVRYDVVAMEEGRIHWYKNAFEYIGR